MKRWAMLLGLLFMVGCGSSGGDDPLVGNWLYENGSTGAGLTFKADGTYAFLVLSLTSATAGNVQAEIGHYTADGQTLAFTPAQASCPGAHPAYTETYAVSASSLTVTDSSGALIFVPNTTPPTSSELTYGCFNNGSFTASPLAPVSN